MRLTLSFFIFSMLGFVNVAYACMCGATSVCDAYGQANTVVIAEVLDYKPMNISFDRIFIGGNTSEFETGQEVTLKVHKWYKGATTPTIKLAQPNSSCDWVFDDQKRNKKYLFYLSYNKKYHDYSVIPCGRSAEMKRAFDDLQWLNALPGSLRRTRISGTSRISDDSNTFPPAAQISVFVEGEKDKFRLTTNDKGVYEKWDVAPGKYRIRAEPSTDLILDWTTSVPNNWLFFWSLDPPNKSALDVTIEPRKCGGIDFMFKMK